MIKVKFYLGPKGFYVGPIRTKFIFLGFRDHEQICEPIKSVNSWNIINGLKIYRLRPI